MLNKYEKCIKIYYIFFMYIKYKYNNKFVNIVNSNDSVKDELDKDFFEIKELLLNKNVK